MFVFAKVVLDEIENALLIATKSDRQLNNGFVLLGVFIWLALGVVVGIWTYVAQRRFFDLYKAKTGIDLMRPEELSGSRREGKPPPIITFSANDPFHARAMNALAQHQTDQCLEEKRKAAIKSLIAALFVVFFGVSIPLVLAAITGG